MTPEGSLDLARTQTEFRAERLGVALRGLAAELVDERRKVAVLRREIAVLRSQLGSFTPVATGRDSCRLGDDAPGRGRLDGSRLE